jgi:hypothetical protein
LFRAQGKNLRSALKGKDGKDLLSLCGVSKSLNVVCNESGSFFHYVSDRPGFNNPGDLDRADIVTLGGSFTLGNCVPREKSVIDVLRSRTGNLINLGSGGNRPIFMFAGLRECSARLKPVIFLQQRYRDSAE